MPATAADSTTAIFPVPLMVTVPQAARLLGVSRASVYRAIGCGALELKEIYPGGPRRLRYEDLAAIGRN